MEVRNLIKPSATVVKITEISAGDVYKRLEEPPYGEPKVVYGVVIDVLNNGEQSSLVALEFTPVSYSPDIKAVTKVFSGSTNVNIFPAAVEEYLDALHQAIEVQEDIVSKAKADLFSKQAVLEHMTENIERNLSHAKVKEVQA